MAEQIPQSTATVNVQRRAVGWTVWIATCLFAAVIGAGAYDGSLTANLHGEYFNIARAIHKGRGFADPFGVKTGPTAWQGPLIPGLEAAVLWLSDGNTGAVVGVLAVLHSCVLTATAFLMMVIARQTCGRFGAIGAAVVFAVVLIGNWRFLWFQVVTDPWMNLMFLDLFIAALFWARPLERWPKAIGWGVLGGLSALGNPTLGLVWIVLTVAVGVQGRAWRTLGVAFCVAGLTVTPWMVRNYLVFGRFVPVKSNLGYEFYQAQCLQEPGVLTVAWFGAHPGNIGNREHREYQRLGEPDYIARKWEQFADAVRADPLDFLERLASRFLCATLWYESSTPAQDAQRPWLIWFNRITHPLPFLALIVLLIPAIQGRLRAIEWFAIGIYVLYLMPYVVTSYYDRYAMPLLGVKVLLLIWAVQWLADVLKRRHLNRQ